MTETIYHAAICGVEGNYGVVFPDFLGCVSAGDTLVEAAEMAHEALQLHVGSMIEDGDPLPEPRRYSMDEVDREFSDPNDPVDEPWVRMIDVMVDTSPRPETIPVRVRATLVNEIAELATETAWFIDSRRFIEQAVEHEIERYRKSAA